MTNYLNLLSELDESPEKLYKRHTGFTVHNNNDSSDEEISQTALLDLAKFKPPPYTFKEIKELLSESESDEAETGNSENNTQKGDVNDWISVGNDKQKTASKVANDVIIVGAKKRKRKKKIPPFDDTPIVTEKPDRTLICRTLKELLNKDKCYICNKEGGRKHYRKPAHYKNVHYWLDNQCKDYFDRKLLYCEVCNLPLNGNVDSMAHYMEDEHKLNLESFCTICLRSMDPADLKKHNEMKHPELNKLSTQSQSASVLSLAPSSLAESEDSTVTKTKRKRHRKREKAVKNYENIETPPPSHGHVHRKCPFCTDTGNSVTHFKKKSHYEKVIEAFNLYPDKVLPKPYKKFMCLPCHEILRGDLVSRHFKSSQHVKESEYFCPGCLVYDNSVSHQKHRSWWKGEQLQYEFKDRFFNPGINSIDSNRGPKQDTITVTKETTIISNNKMSESESLSMDEWPPLSRTRRARPPSPYPVEARPRNQSNPSHDPITLTEKQLLLMSLPISPGERQACSRPYHSESSSLTQPQTKIPSVVKDKDELIVTKGAATISDNKNIESEFSSSDEWLPSSAEWLPLPRTRRVSKPSSYPFDIPPHNQFYPSWIHSFSQEQRLQSTLLSLEAPIDKFIVTRETATISNNKVSEHIKEFLNEWPPLPQPRRERSRPESLLLRDLHSQPQTKIPSVGKDKVPVTAPSIQIIKNPSGEPSGIKFLNNGNVDIERMHRNIVRSMLQLEDDALTKNIKLLKGDLPTELNIAPFADQIINVGDEIFELKENVVGPIMDKSDVLNNENTGNVVEISCTDQDEVPIEVLPKEVIELEENIVDPIMYNVNTSEGESDDVLNNENGNVVEISCTDQDEVPIEVFTELKENLVDLIMDNVNTSEDKSDDILNNENGNVVKISTTDKDEVPIVLTNDVPDDDVQCVETSNSLSQIDMEIVLDGIDIVAAVIILYVFRHYLFPY